MCITLHLCVVQSSWLELLYRKRMIVTSSSFLEDAARKWFCFVFYVKHFPSVPCLWSCFLPVFAVFIRNPLHMLHPVLIWRLYSELTQYSFICVILWKSLLLFVYINVKTLSFPPFKKFFFWSGSLSANTNQSSNCFLHAIRNIPSPNFFLKKESKSKSKCNSLEFDKLK